MLTIELRALTVVVGAVLGVSTPTIGAQLPPKNHPTILVTNCNESGEGSLRDAFAWVEDGGTVDLTELTCGTITLALGELVVGQDSVALAGPGARNLTITSGRSSPIVDHTARGTLSVSGLTFVDGSLRDRPRRIRRVHLFGQWSSTT